MRSLSIQVQPERSPGLDMQRLAQAFESIADMRDLVNNHAFGNGFDDGAYFNFNFDTSRAEELWKTVQKSVYQSPEFREHMACASMAMCSSDEGWHDYLQLFHFDPLVEIDTFTN